MCKKDDENIPCSVKKLVNLHSDRHNLIQGDEDETLDANVCSWSYYVSLGSFQQFFRSDDQMCFSVAEAEIKSMCRRPVWFSQVRKATFIRRNQTAHKPLVKLF